MEIRFSNDVPDETYFRVGDVEPRVDGNVITLFDGKGTSRRWGRPGVTSTVVVEAPDFVAVHVGFHHKHGGGQFWRFYYVNGDIVPVEWKNLPDEVREVVLQAIADGKAPSWARTPGKLRKDYRKPEPPPKFMAFKVVRIVDGKFLSLWDDTVYELARTNIEQVRPNHGGGYYVYTGQDIKERFLNGKIGKRLSGQKYAVLQCECWGRREYYDVAGDCISHWPPHQRDRVLHKIAVTYVKPLRIVEVFETA